MGPVWVAVAAIGGIGVGYLIRLLYVRWMDQSAQKQRDEIVQRAGEEAASIKKEADLAAKAERIKAREEFERESQVVRKELRQQERRLIKREDSLEKKMEVLD